jgi:hypothetical protein
MIYDLVNRASLTVEGEAIQRNQENINIETYHYLPHSNHAFWPSSHVLELTSPIRIIRRRVYAPHGRSGGFFVFVPAEFYVALPQQPSMLCMINSTLL